MSEEASVVARTDGESIFVECSNIGDRDLVGLIPGSKWRANHGHWELNLTWSSCKALRATFGDSLLIDDTLVEWAVDEMDSRVTPCMEIRDLLHPEFQLDKQDMDPRLYPYQVVGAQFLATARHGIVSDPPGAGKTAQAVSALRTLNALPALVIAPKSTLISWGREVEQWWPGTPVYVVSGTKKKKTKILEEAMETPGVVIINWEAVRLHSRLAPYGAMRLSEEHRTDKELNHIPFRVVIADEAHRLQNPQSIQTRAVWHLGDSPSVEYRWALTGTPLTNQIDTIWSVLRFLNKEEWPSKVAFIDRYALTRVVPWGTGTEVIGLNPHNEEEFQEIFQPRFRRMPKEVILPQLPPIQRTRRYLEMSPEQTRCYNEMAEEMVAETESGELLIASNPAVKAIRMVQFSSATVDFIVPNSTVNVDSEEEVFGERIARLVNPSNKLDALMDDLPDLLEAGESVVVFAVSRQLIEMAEDRLQEKKINYSVIKGGQTPNLRQLNIDDFQNGNSKVILVVVAAGGVGLTLTAGRIAIFLQRSWSFVENHQAEGRIHRIGSEIHDSIEIIDYVSRGTIDETVIEVAEGKEVSLEQIVRDRDAVRRMLHGEGQ